MILKQNRPAKNDKAVILCCDKNVSDIASFVLARIATLEPGGDYDLCLCTFEPELDLAYEVFPDIRVCHIDPQKFDGLPTTEILPITSYLRLALPDIFATDYAQIVYLDTDIFPLNAKMSELFQEHIPGRAVSAVLDVSQWDAKLPPERDVYMEKLGLSGKKYFNSGVMLIDTEAYRTQGIFDGTTEFAHTHAAHLDFFDQSALNGYLKGEWHTLSLKWNWQALKPFHSLVGAYQPHLLHFIGHTKPYLPNGARYSQPYRAEYEAFFANTLKKEIDVPPFDYKLANPTQQRPKRRKASPLERKLKRLLFLPFRRVWGKYNRFMRRLRLNEIERAIGQGAALWPTEKRRADLKGK